MKALLESWAGIDVVGEVDDLDDAARVALEWDPDIVLLDTSTLEDSEVLGFLGAVQENASQARSILLTDNKDRQMLVDAITAGAMGVVLQDQGPEILEKAIRKVYAGEVWIERTLTAEALRRMGSPSGNYRADANDVNIAKLSSRERDVISGVCQGRQNVMIGQDLAISEATVRHHLTSIYNKLGLKNRVELVTYALAHGIVKAK
jgi:DNA-binding NarL/FixJ family response regulator